MGICMLSFYWNERPAATWIRLVSIFYAVSQLLLASLSPESRAANGIGSQAGIGEGARKG